MVTPAVMLAVRSRRPSIDSTDGRARRPWRAEDKDSRRAVYGIMLTCSTRTTAHGSRAPPVGGPSSRYLSKSGHSPRRFAKSTLEAGESFIKGFGSGTAEERRAWRHGDRGDGHTLDRPAQARRPRRGPAALGGVLRPAGGAGPRET